MSPIFRTHCRYCEQRIWTFPEPYYSWMRTTMLLRNSLVPYIYSTAYLQAYLGGRGIVSPMYYDYPESDEAYTYETQYMFGPALLASPIAVQPASQNASATVRKAIWLPPDTAWLDLLTGTLESGPQRLNRSYSLNQLPLFAKAGAVLPTRALAAQHQNYPDAIRWKLIKGSGNGSGDLYEDAADNMNYKQGEATLTRLTYTGDVAKMEALNVVISPAAPLSPGGTAPPGMPTKRVHSIELAGVSSLPSSAACAGDTLGPVAPESGPGFWKTVVNSTLTGSTLESVVIACAPQPLSGAVKLRAQFSA